MAREGARPADEAACLPEIVPSSGKQASIAQPVTVAIPAAPFSVCEHACQATGSACLPARVSVLVKLGFASIFSGPEAVRLP